MFKGTQSRDEWDAAWSASFAELEAWINEPTLHEELTEAELADTGDRALLVAGAELDLLTENARRGRAEAAARAGTMAAVLINARAHPDVWVGLDPTLDPAYAPPDGAPVSHVRQRRKDMAVRGAACDIAARLRLSENTVRTLAHRAATLQERTPSLWARCVTGDVSEQNFATAASLADTLPADGDAWAAFDEAITEPAARLAPGRFRVRARAARERVHPESLQNRHERAMRDRGVWVDPDPDGMATLSAFLPADKAYALVNRLDADARRLRGGEGEDRTLAQLRADVLCDLAAIPTGTTAPPVSATISITIPVLTLLGCSDEPATLDGYGPIPLDTARELAAGAASWRRVLTHPVTGTVLDVDTYRVPAALARLVRARHPVCTHPGCHKPAQRCDLDHRVAWADGGTTSVENLHPLCEPHHTGKHETLWRLRRNPKTNLLYWVTPTGFRTDTDPPPF